MAAAVGWLVGEPLCFPLGIGPAHLWQLSRRPAPPAPSLGLAEVEQAFAQARNLGREQALASVGALFDKLTETERALVVGALTGTLRQGSLGGVMLLALADFSGRDEATVRRVMMVTGSIARAAEALLGQSGDAEPPTSLRLFCPLAPMLAAASESLDEALALVEGAQIEWKIDGVRAQIHKQGDRVAVYSRQGNDITEGCASLVGAFSSLRADTAVLDGEVVLLGPEDAARPFQDSFSAVASKAPLPEGDRLVVYLFDCMHRDGTDLLDEPLSARVDALRAIAPAELCVPQERAVSSAQARDFYTRALASGHEGVMVKDPRSPYRFGSRGHAWTKVKESHTVDLVVLAAEWGSGRRTGFLSNLHLGARRSDGTFCMVGKTFKGLTDAMLASQTETLGSLATDRTEHVVYVKPELVVEVRFNDVQRSPRYPGGIALRFARVVRHRPDKPAHDVEPLEALVALLPVAALAPRSGSKRRKKKGGSGEAEADPQLSLFDE